MQIKRPAVHGQILRALARNTKLPQPDRVKVDEALERYKDWRANLETATGDVEALLRTLVSATNKYKRFIELDLVFLSKEDFLYRQSGQLKLTPY